MSEFKTTGWAGEDEAKRAWDAIGSQFDPFFIAGQTEATEGGTYRLWDYTRKVLGEDTPNYAQKTGDCVSFGAKNAIEYLSCMEIARNGDAEQFKPIFAPYLYATGRVKIGNNKLRGRAGSLGSWMAKAVQEYGTIPADLDGLPDYSGQLADQWGDGRGDWTKWIEHGDDHLIKSASRITSWNQLVDANGNGYPVTIASNLGFNMKPSADGFHKRRGSWAHQMCIVGASDDRSKPWAGVLNSWGANAHGTVIDFETGEEWPAGMLRVRPEDLDPAFRSGELFAFSQFDGFPEQNLSWNFM